MLFFRMLITISKGKGTCHSNFKLINDAAVSDKAIDGDKVDNRAWVNDSEEDIVDGPVIDPDVPSTGGIGTKAFTAAGIALMGVAAGAVIVTGKRKKKEQ